MSFILSQRISQICRVCPWGRQWKACKCNASIKCISTSHRSHPKKGKNRKKKKKNNFKSAIPFTWHSNHFYRKRMSARKEVTCTYLHHTKPHILSLFFLSPTLFLCLSLLSFQRQATHRPHRAHEAAAEHYHLPDMGQQKPKPYGYIGRGQSTILSHADTQPSTAWFTWTQMMWTANNREANRRFILV